MGVEFVGVEVDVLLELNDYFASLTGTEGGLMLLAAAAVAWNVLAIDPSEAGAIAARLEGQRFTIAADQTRVTIDDVAGLGAPEIGVIELRGEALWTCRPAARRPPG